MVGAILAGVGLASFGDGALVTTSSILLLIDAFIGFSHFYA